MRRERPQGEGGDAHQRGKTQIERPYSKCPANEEHRHIDVAAQLPFEPQEPRQEEGANAEEKVDTHPSILLEYSKPGDLGRVVKEHQQGSDKPKTIERWRIKCSPTKHEICCACDCLGVEFRATAVEDL